MRILLGVFWILAKTNCEYSELMNMELGVNVELPQIIYDNNSIITSTGHPRCSFSLHKSGLNRDVCSGPKLGLKDKISWSTRVCYKWQCHTTKYAMRVENCWIGTPRNPVFIVRKDGCTVEKAILTTPFYSSYNKAMAIGWISVRQKDMQFINVGCTIRLCHICDISCQEMTPPRSCNDNLTYEYEAMWNSSSKMRDICFPTTTISPNLLLDTNSSKFSNSCLFSIILMIILNFQIFPSYFS